MRHRCANLTGEQPDRRGQWLARGSLTAVNYPDQDVPAFDGVSPADEVFPGERIRLLRPIKAAGSPREGPRRVAARRGRASNLESPDATPV